MKIDATRWKARSKKARDPKPSDTGYWEIESKSLGYMLCTDGRFSGALARFKEAIGNRRPQDVTVS